MSRTLAAILGAAGVVALVVIAYLIWFCLFHKKSASRSSETGSSDPSVQVGRHGVELALREARRFQMEELSSATNNFSDRNLIGFGKFGEVYKGLLNDGMLVAIKRRSGTPTQEFVDEVRYLAPIQHRNIVTLLGYCQVDNQQLLVYEYIPSGSVSSYLYAAGQVSDGKLEFKLRLSIALGAAKGLAHLHSLTPRLLHKDFKTANVLVDENFIAKVADAGLRNFLGRTDIAGPSSRAMADEMFLAPELYSGKPFQLIPDTVLAFHSYIPYHACRVIEFRRFSDKSDVFSFGVFLLELLSGREASEPPFPETTENLVEWVGDAYQSTWFVPNLLLVLHNGKGYGISVLGDAGGIKNKVVHYFGGEQVQNIQDYSNFSRIVDKKMGSSFTAEGMEEFIQVMMRCIERSSERRPAMSYVVMELDRILEKETSVTTLMGEGAPTVTLGSHLFRAAK